jgi:hypothetical protein
VVPWLVLHYWKNYKKEIPSYLKPFQMICGLVSPKSIGLINREHINQLLKKSKLMFKITKLAINYSIVCWLSSVVDFIPL